MPWYRLTDTQKKAIQLALRDAYPDWPWRAAKAAKAAKPAPPAKKAAAVKKAAKKAAKRSR